MYLGKIVELSPAEELYERPIMPYTEALLSAVPIPDPRESAGRERIVLEGDVPSPINPPSGCRFHPRCRYATEICSQLEPPLVDYGNGHLAACHHPLNVDKETLARATADDRRRRALVRADTARRHLPRLGRARLDEARGSGLRLPRRAARLSDRGLAGSGHHCE